MRVVLDTNVLISACLKPGGLEARVVEMAIAEEVQLWATAEVWAEYGAVMARDKFRSVREMSDQMLERMEPHTRWAPPVERVTAASDEDDNRFLECALSANADFLITGNLRHYPQQYYATRIMNARSFLEASDRR